MNKQGKITTGGLFRLAGLCAIFAGILYITIQFIHPSENISSVNTSLGVIVSVMSITMSICSLIGILGIYIRQVEEAGWLGLIGFIAFSLFWLLSMTFSFIEAFVLPLITSDAPKFVEGILGLFGESKSEVPLGIFSILAPLAGLLYLVGGLILGIATYRANILPRMAGGVLAISAVITLAAAVIPHPADRILAIPMGIAFIWLGFDLCLSRYKREDK